MSYADKIFVEMCQDIIENGVSTEGEQVRPKWEDGSFAYTIKKFGVVNRYDLSKEFPAITLRKTALKSCMDEILWIWQRKSNNIKDLNSHVWDEWADSAGSIGKAYGYQVKKKYFHHTEPYDKQRIEELKKMYPSTRADAIWKAKMNVYFDQIDAVLYDLRNNPYSRRIVTNLYNHKDLHEMNLYPCAYSLTFNVTQKKDEDKPRLNVILNQRSQDILAANNWNVCQYAILVMMLAQVCDMIPGELLHVISDCHIYDKHIDIIKELIQRPQHSAPKVHLNPEVKDFYAFTIDDLIVEDYITGPQIKNIPIAI